MNSTSERKVREGFLEEAIFKLGAKEPVMQRVVQQLSRQTEKHVQRSRDRKAIGLWEEQKGH